MRRRFTPVSVVVASLLLFSGCRGLSPRESAPLPLPASSGPVDFDDLNTFAGRASAAYATADAIRARYPKTVRVNSPGTVDVQYFLEQDSAANTQHVTIRGTANRENFLEDVDFTVRDTRAPAIPVAAGFDVVARAIFDDVTAHLNKRDKTSLTGHSLGGAVAAILALYLIDDGYQVGRVVTFGQPRFTTTVGVKSRPLQALKRVLTRVVDENDLVPMLPPESRRSGQYGPYEHIGREIILLQGPYYVDLPNHVAAPLSIDDSWRSLATAKLGDHHIADYLARLSTKLVSAVSVPYEDREKYVARPRK